MVAGGRPWLKLFDDLNTKLVKKYLLTTKNIFLLTWTPWSWGWGRVAVAACWRGAPGACWRGAGAGRSAACGWWGWGWATRWARSSAHTATLDGHGGWDKNNFRNETYLCKISYTIKPKPK